MTCNYTQLCLEKQDHFTFGGELSTDYGLILIGERDFSSPEREVKKVRILGKDGDCMIDQKRYESYQRKLDCYLIVSDYKELPNQVRKLRGWLNRSAGYKELVFSYDEESIYMACQISRIDAAMIDVQIAHVQLEFNVKPFVYSFDSFIRLEMISQDVLFNEYELDALPYIKIVGNGDITLHINNRSYNFKGIDGWIEIDSEIKIVYKNNNGIIENRSAKAANRTFPHLEEGENNISWTGGVTSIEVEPRWRSR